MLLAVDIGNTETTAGLFQGTDLVGHWRLTTSLARTPDEWAALLSLYLVNAGHSPSAVRSAVIASVAPLVTQSVVEGVRSATGVTAVLVDARSALGITLAVDEPLTVGADRIVNTLGASRLFSRDTIVVDFGTATTFDCITADGSFLGGVIMPGIRTASDELVRRTAKLPATELTPPPHVIGKRTEDCIRAGVLWGTAEAVDGIVRRIRAEWPEGRVPLVVATGGLAPLVAGLCREIESVHPNLTLVGLRLAAQVLGLGW
jgi:type III pantothenate kinase